MEKTFTINFINSSKEINQKLPSTKTFSNAFYAFDYLHKSTNYNNWQSTADNFFKSYRSNWVLRPANKFADDFPLTLNIEITRRCNLACTFCWHKDLEEDEKYDMDFELFKTIIDEAKLYNMPAVNLNGLGEPMLHKFLPDMIRYCRDAGIKDIMFHTNATVMTEQRAEELIDAGLTQIIFSLDSPDPLTYESMRINGKHRKVVDNVAMFIATRDRLKRSLPIIRVTMVLTEKTIGQVEEFNQIWRDKVDLVTVQDLLFSYDSDVGQGDTSKFKSMEKSYYSIDKTQILEKERESGNSFCCPYLYQSMKIHNDGSIDACSPKEAPQLGHIKDGIHKVWTGERMQQIRKLHEDGRWREVPECNRCDIPYIELHKRHSVKNDKIL
jgi:radical SAM protein with 4Fe4S-binding SPASM domain